MIILFHHWNFSNHASRCFKHSWSNDSMLSNSLRISLIFVWVSFRFFKVTFDILLIHLSYTTLSLFIWDSLVAQDSQSHSSRFVTVAMNKRLQNLDFKLCQYDMTGWYIDYNERFWLRPETSYNYISLFLFIVFFQVH